MRTRLWVVAVALWAAAPTCAETHVISVGVERYEDELISSLRYAAADATAVAAAFRAAGVPPKNVLLFTSDQTDPARRPTRINLLTALDAVRGKAGPDDRLIVFFAGHGVELDGQQYLLTVDARQSLVADTSLPLRLVNRALEGLRAAEVLFLIDACRNDPQAGRGDTDATLTDGLARGLRPTIAPTGGPRQVATLLACDVGQRAWEDPEQRHGVFSIYLLRGLAGEAKAPDGLVHLRSLAAYVEQQVQAWAERRGKVQRPRLVAPDGGDPVLLKPPAEPVVSVAFERRPLSDAVAFFAREYGVQVVLGDGVDASLPLSGWLDNQPLSVALKLLLAAAKLTFRREGEVYVIELGATPTPQRATVVIGGQPVRAATHAMVLGDQATPSEQRAAGQLQTWLARITGETLPLVKASQAGGKSWLLVGRSQLADQVAGPVDYLRLGPDGIRQKVVGQHLLLTGNQRGVLYAVYRFLSDTLGCNWYAADCVSWPTTGRLEVPDLDLTYVPPLEYRALDDPLAQSAEFAVANQLNGHLVEADASWGGRIAYEGFAHTFQALVPAAEHFAAHPEYYALVGGERRATGAQLCLTNPEVRRVAVATIRGWLARNPQAGIVSVSQNDCGGFCECPRCRALVAAEGAESGPVLHFVNAVADDLAPDHPNLLIDTLAYQQTVAPPRQVKTRPNVGVRLCSIECEFNRPFAESARNEPFAAALRAWSKVCQRLYVWDYTTNFAHTLLPHPNLRVLQPNLQFCIANHVRGVYAEGAYFTPGAEMAPLRTWLLAKLMWWPDFPVEQGINQFLTAYYGEAAPHLHSYLDETHRLATSDPGFQLTVFTAPSGPLASSEALSRYDRSLDRAEAAVQADAVLLQRVRTARLPTLYGHLLNRTLPPGAESRQELLQRFAAVARAAGVKKVSERTSLEQWLAEQAAVR